MSGKQKVLILGGLGFIGKNLYLALIHKGFTVKILADTIHHEDAFLASEVKQDVIQGSVLDRDLMNEIVQGYQVIFSLAGRSGASDSIANPYTDLDRNLKGHLNILEACRMHNPNALLIFPSSRLVYGKPITQPVNEKHELHPESIYAIHKLTVEQYYLVYKRLYNINCVIFRISNPYGPHQRFGSNNYGILNWFIHKAVQHEPIEIYGDGSQQRDFIHITDLVELLMLSMEKQNLFGHIYNVGYGKGIALKDAAALIKKYVPHTNVVFKPWPEIDGKIETGDYITDIQALREATGWEPTITFEEGIRDTIKFYEGSYN